MITGRNDADSVMKAKDKGVTAYIRKPFTIEELQSKLQAIYERTL